MEWTWRPRNDSKAHDQGHGTNPLSQRNPHRGLWSSAQVDCFESALPVVVQDMQRLNVPCLSEIRKISRYTTHQDRAQTGYEMRQATHNTRLQAAWSHADVDIEALEEV